MPPRVGTNAAVLFFRAECFCEGGEDTRFPLLREVFEAFPYTPVNIDIKVNDDTLIKKVRPVCSVQHVESTPRHNNDSACISRQVSELVVKYDREHLTVWGNSSNQIVKKCYKEVCLFVLHAPPERPYMFTLRSLLPYVSEVFVE